MSSQRRPIIISPLSGITLLRPHSLRAISCLARLGDGGIARLEASFGLEWMRSGELINDEWFSLCEAPIIGLICLTSVSRNGRLRNISNYVTIIFGLTSSNGRVQLHCSNWIDMSMSFRTCISMTMAVYIIRGVALVMSQRQRVERCRCLYRAFKR